MCCHLFTPLTPANPRHKSDVSVAHSGVTLTEMILYKSKSSVAEQKVGYDYEFNSLCTSTYRALEQV